MTTIKSFTSLEQSKKLAEILPIESADCFWDYDDLQKYHRINWFEDGYDKDSQLRLNKNNVCAWSLAALLDILPKIINNETLFIETSASLWHIGYRNIYTARADNPVDACYEMILKLHKLNLL